MDIAQSALRSVMHLNSFAHVILSIKDIVINKRHRNQKYRVVGKLNNSALKYLLRFLFSDGDNNNCTCCQKNYKSGNNDKQRIERIAS